MAGSMKCGRCMINRATHTVACGDAAVRMCDRCLAEELKIERKKPRTVSPILKEYQ